MDYLIKGAKRFRMLCATAFSISMITAGISAIPERSHAQTQVNYAAAPLVVRNDRGGLLRARLNEIRTLRQQSRPVEIRGGICFSTCTMFLGLPNTCVSPNTTFGFHGPSSYGRALSPALFQQASEIIASHYPAPLRAWYMQKARHQIIRVQRVKGEQIIKMGVRAC